MSDTKRTILAGLIIGFLTLCIPFYLRLIGVMPENQETPSDVVLQEDFVVATPNTSPLSSALPNNALNQSAPAFDGAAIFFSVVSDKYNAIEPVPQKRS